MPCFWNSYIRKTFISLENSLHQFIHLLLKVHPVFNINSIFVHSTQVAKIIVICQLVIIFTSNISSIFISLLLWFYFPMCINIYHKSPFDFPPFHFISFDHAFLPCFLMVPSTSLYLFRCSNHVADQNLFF